MYDEMKQMLPDLNQAVIGSEELIRMIDYTRQLTEYATPEQVANFMKMRSGTQHIYTRDINVGGVAVKDDMEKYLSASDYYSNSQLKEALKTPLHLFYARESGWKQELERYIGAKDYFDMGTYLHMCLLEPTKFSRVLVEPKYGLNSTNGVNALVEFWENRIIELGFCEVKEEQVSAQDGLNAAHLAVDEMKLDINKIDGKKAYYNILKKISGLEAVKEEHALIIDIVRRNYERYGDGMIMDLLKHSKREISMYYTDPETGLKVRIRPDAIQFAENIGCNAIISVKSTRAESLGHYYYQSAKLCYEHGEGMYQDVATGVTGRDFNCTINIIFQTVPPFGVAVLVWNAEDIEIGKYKYRQALRTAKECEDKRLYPGYDAYAESGHLGLIAMKQPQWNSKELFPTDLED